MDIQPINAPKVPQDFHIKLRQRFFKAFQQDNLKNELFSSSISLFKGVPTIPKNYEDTEYYVEQEASFWYLFGVKEPDCYAVIQNQTGDSVLFVPRYDQAYQMWMYVKPLQKFKCDYKVQSVLYVDELQKYIQSKKPSQLFLLSGVDSDSKLSVAEPQQKYLKFFDKENINRESLWTVMSNIRVIKTEDEIELIKYVCKLTTEAHITAMKSAKPGLLQHQMHVVFNFQHAIKCGSHQIGFASICSSGQDCATLHYIQNDKIIEQGQMLLHDMGGKWYGYVADQAITFPVSGKFTQKQKAIYNSVYYAQKAVLQALKPGVNWDDMHILAQKTILEHLIQIGIVNKYPMEQLVQKRVGAVFFPHGLGHFFGLRVHDVGGYTKGPQRSDKAGLKSLRTRRTIEQNMVITVQPGCYFIDFIIKKALNDPEMSKYFNADKILQYRQVGGVRLQDDVVVRKEGVQMLSFLPRKWQDVEATLAK